MTARSPGAFMLSATFHALIIGTIVLFAYVTSQQEKVTPKVLELVAGEGDNYAATEAPALGSPTGVKVQLKELPPMPEPVAAPEPIQVEPEATPVKPEPIPVKPVPTPVKPAPTPPPKTTAAKAAKAAPTVPNFSREILRKRWAADWRAKRQIAKEKAEEEKRARAAAAAARKAARVQHIDAEGIAKGVVGGSTSNKVGGAGGKALVSDGAGGLADRYYAMLKQRVLNALDKPAGVSEDLVATVDFHIWPDGRITNVHVVKSSGSEDFDRAVLAAFSRVQMPEHPEHKSEDLELDIRTRDAGQ